jgi:alkaline phosphatase D
MEVRGSRRSAGVSRRGFLQVGLAGLASLAARCELPVDWLDLAGGLRIEAYPFTLGVASGDPRPDRVVLWTRLAPEPLAAVSGAGLPPEPIPVLWELADDDGFRRIRRAGAALAHPALAHSVHVDVTGLDPDRWYFYRFAVGPFASEVGRTRTLPAAASAPAQLRFATASCQNYKEGYYTAHFHLAQEDLDFVAFLGDYVYESGVDGPVRSHDGPRLRTLADYRNRYALYKSDANLQAAHRAFPWIVTWDDHEVSDDYAGLLQDENAPDSAPPPEEFEQVRAAAYQAWYEHMPVRLAPPEGPHLPIFRSFRFGDLARLFVLDTRQYRTDQECGGQIAEPCAGFPRPDGDLLGAEQESWLQGGLEEAAATGTIWKPIAQQVVFSPTPIGPLRNFDQWDGYPFARQRLVDFVRERAISNFVVLTGDVHASGAGYVPADPVGFTQPVGSEFVATGISSTIGDPVVVTIAEIAFAQLPHIRYFNARQQGYIRHTVGRRVWRTDYRLVDTVLAPVSGIATAASFAVEDGFPGPWPA